MSIDGQEELVEAKARRVETRRAIDRCKDCDDVGRLDDLTDCPRHANFRTPMASRKCGK